MSKNANHTDESQEDSQGPSELPDNALDRNAESDVNVHSDRDADVPVQQQPQPNDQPTPDRSGAQTIPLSTASLVGSQLAGYLILSRLGRGGMADVYAARDLELERDVAIKILRPDLAKDRDYIKRFRREAKAAAKLNHGNIVQIYEVGEAESHHYIAQELISGQNLREYLDRNGAVSPEQAVDILFGVSSALDAAAVEGITHRDIKPENVMWSKAGTVKVADFGLARLGDESDGSRADLTQAGLTLGTPRYMSPEQVQGHPVDPRSDLYSLGVMMYHLLAGRPPFEADDPLALAFAHVNETPKPLDRARGDKDVPEWLVAIVSKLLRKAPSERFQSAGELLDALTGDDSDQHRNARRLAGAATATARLQRVADEEKRQRTVRRRRAVVLALFPLLFVGLGVALASGMRSPMVTDLLRPDAIDKYESVEEQFVEAARLNSVAGWRSVGDYFPADENAMNRSYATKASLQLARLLIDQGRGEHADLVLDELLRKEDIDRKFRLIALARRVQAAQQMNQPRSVVEAKRVLKAFHADVSSSNSDAIEFFNAIFSRSEQAALGLVPNEQN